MYGIAIPNRAFGQIADEMQNFKLKKGVPNDLKSLSQQMKTDNGSLFRRLEANIQQSADDDDTEHFATTIYDRTQMNISNLIDHANVTHIINYI